MPPEGDANEARYLSHANVHRKNMCVAKAWKYMLIVIYTNALNVELSQFPMLDTSIIFDLT